MENCHLEWRTAICLLSTFTFPMSSSVCRHLQNPTFIFEVCFSDRLAPCHLSSSPIQCCSHDDSDGDDDDDDDEYEYDEGTFTGNVGVDRKT